MEDANGSKGAAGELAASLAAVSASSFPVIPWWDRIQMKVMFFNVADRAFITLIESEKMATLDYLCWPLLMHVK